MKKRIARRRDVALCFVRGAQVCPGVCGPRIQRQRDGIRLNSAPDVQVFQAVLPIATQPLPVLEVLWLKPFGMFIAFAGLEARIMSGERVANTEVGKKYRTNKGKSEHHAATLGTGKMQNHSTVLCLVRMAVATQNWAATSTMVGKR